MSKQYAGLRRIGHSSTIGGTITWLSGKPSPDGAPNPDVTTTETATGVIFGGGSTAPEIPLFNMTGADISKVEGWHEGDDEFYWHLEFVGDVVYRSKIPFNMMIRPDMQANARDGVQSHTLLGERFHTANIWEITP
jgi:hypothetical protein